MTYCINPHCPKPVDPVNANNLICRNCGSEMLLQGRYRVLKQLGQGGFGNTFEVDECGKTKVLKVLTEKNPKAIELFQQEAKVLSQLNSAGIPKVEPDGYFTVLPKNSFVPLHCLAMEKIEGVNLEQWMEFRNYQRLSEAQALNWLKQLVEILALVHAHQYFHRDIKPQNIMLRPSGQLVLIDFGAVRQITTTILAGNSHTRIISQGYSPPEQQNGYSVQQSDFFALGRTFIFLLTGKEPQDKAIYDPLTNELHWRNYAVNISPFLADLIDHLMAYTANQRPENTGVILQKLKDIEQGLNQIHIFKNTTKSQSKNSVSGTVAVSPGKPVTTTAKQTQKSFNWWTLMIGFFLARSIIYVLNQNNNQDVFKNVDTTPISPSISNSSPVIPISKSTPAKPQIKPSPVNVVSSEDVEAEKARREEIEKQKRQAALKAEQERQSAIRKERAAKEAEKEREAETEKRELEAAILAQLKEQAALREKQKRQATIQAENAKQALRKKSQTTIVTVPKKRQLSTKGKVTRKKPKNIQRANNNVVNAAKPWETTYTMPKSSDELEQVIREGNQ
ncbi:protein kinase [uncultured Nostoc sp.]|uniref:protein kinase domain-containing protein n=1 Tax=uncultured Nostoc sp. TaxID=340711 RepID=UPI0035CB43C5